MLCLGYTFSPQSYLIQELSGRTIKVEFAKQFKKPSPRPSTPQVQETRYKLYVSNLAWKARSSHLRDFVSLNFKTPVSARVVFDGPSGKSGGYGFVSFATKEEAEEAISALNGHVRKLNFMSLSLYFVLLLCSSLENA